MTALTLEPYLAVVRGFGDDPAEIAVHSGQFHHVLLTSTRAYRIPRTRTAAAALRQRAGILHILSELALGVGVPVPVALVAKPDFLCLVTSRIPGEPLDPGVLADPGVLDSVADQLARVLSALGAAAVRAAGRFPVTPPRRWHDFAEDVRARLFPRMSPRGRARAAAELDAVVALSAVDAALVHGDLGGENLLWVSSADGPLLSGIVDWDEVALGDPAEDLAALMAGYGAALGERITDRRNGSSGMLARAHVIRATFALQQALSAALDDDPDELADGLRDYLT
ncbi:aminoglycoside phosphotransferase family protein [Nocardia sp. 2]|uniref:Aminoglycoside phosphotransferase family protein n=1 Tax=Nocardia acididurans TaxID=2802282 RepID=A0ABS1M301_9NOCA|nr:aminoglycoside phosphotransferase family protein [Nocardia acididurans]MBL1074706.1 aminoglycoside phosphotransferase family protein [Nocardia acididurans]